MKKTAVDVIEAPNKRGKTDMLRWSGDRQSLKAEATVDQNRTATKAQK